MAFVELAGHLPGVGKAGVPGEPRTRRPSLARSAGRTAVRAVPLLTALVGLAPIAWMFYSSLRPDVFSYSDPFHLTLGNYATSVEELPMAHLFLNTLAMTVGVCAGQLFTGLLAAFALARFKVPGERALLFVLVASWLVPFQITMLPNYVLLSKLGLLNSVVGVALPQLSSAYAVLLLRQHLKAFPNELIEAARMDGRSWWGTLWLVVVPNIAPALFALALLLFVAAWNEYLWPLLVFHTPNAVLQIGIAALLDQGATNYGAIMAVSSLSTVPLLVLYAVLNRRVVNAFVRSGIR